MKDQILQIIKRAIRRSGKIIITFRRGTTQEIGYILNASQRGDIFIDAASEHTLINAARLSYWHNDDDRAITVTIHQDFNAELFAERMQHALEAVTIGD